MTDEKTDVDYFVLLEGVSSCCEEGFRQGVHFMQTKVIPHKVATAEQQAKIEVLEKIINHSERGMVLAYVENMLAELKVTK